MVIKVYISGSSGNKEVKKRQQRVLLILDSKNIKYEMIDIAEPGAEETKDFMQNNSTSLGATIGDPNPRHPLPPQIFNDDVYCGDYDMFDMANEIDEMDSFLKLEPNSLNEQISSAEIKLKNGDVSIDEKIEKIAGKIEEDTKENEVPNEQIKDKDDEQVEEKEEENKAADTEEESKEIEEVDNEEKVETESEKKEDSNAGGDKAEEEESEKKVEELEKEASPEKSE